MKKYTKHITKLGGEKIKEVYLLKEDILGLIDKKAGLDFDPNCAHCKCLKSLREEVQIEE